MGTLRGRILGLRLVAKHVQCELGGLPHDPDRSLQWAFAVWGSKHVNGPHTKFWVVTGELLDVGKKREGQGNEEKELFAYLVMVVKA